LFLLITARPEFRPPSGMRSHHGMVALAPLDRSQVRHMVAELSARHALPKEVVDGVTERTGDCESPGNRPANGSRTQQRLVKNTGAGCAATRS
jgi:hypothetical protein